MTKSIRKRQKKLRQKPFSQRSHVKIWVRWRRAFDQLKDEGLI